MSLLPRASLVLTCLGLLASAPATADTDHTFADRELTVHGFRSPSIGVELREKWLGFHVGLFPLIADDGVDGARTTWFLKTGLTVYPVRFTLGSQRPSGPFASVSLLQGLNNEWNVAESVSQGTGAHGELGFRWAVGRGLDLRLGIGVAIGADRRVIVHPTPGIAWSVAL
ncbi:MAG: hypothetical protein SFX73_07305 [Kofleriaceae bacterium]|nr:hypothetical protein [Kofleriaceae bacterium]